MKKVRLLPSQRETVSLWMQKKQNAKLKQIKDRSCRYRDACIQWCDEIKQPDGSLDIVYFETRLELTPSGKIRVEETKKQKIKTLSHSHRDLLPLENIFFVAITPKRIERSYLYPKDKTKSKVKKVKPQQLKLPTTETELILQEASFRNGDKRVKSVQELYMGTGEIHSINWGIIKIPQALIVLAKQHNCSVTEWEAIAQMSLVLNADRLLHFIQEIPNMRKIPEFSKFQEPVTVIKPQKIENNYIITKQNRLI